MNSSAITNLLMTALLPTIIFASCKTGANSAGNQPLTLKKAYSGLFLIGTALNQQQILGEDTSSLKVVKGQFDAITAENAMKWEEIEPKPDSFNFDIPDKFVEFGLENNMFIVGHTLLWHAQTPDWVFDDGNGNPANRDTLLARLKNHIFTVVGRYKGKVNGWDVVNEAVEDNGEYRDSPWKKIIGDDYIQIAFEYAREADPDAELYYNDYNLTKKPKRDTVIAMIKDLKAKGIKIDGVGIQGHYGYDYPDLQSLDTTIDEIGKLGVKVMITELDVTLLPFPSQDKGVADVSMRFERKEELDPYKNGLPDSVNVLLANRYSSMFHIFVKHSDVVSRVTLWGVNDAQSWRNYWPIYGRTDYPLLFDRNNQPKLAVDSILQCAKKH